MIRIDKLKGIKPLVNKLNKLFSRNTEVRSKIKGPYEISDLPYYSAPLVISYNPL